jgi:peptidoglycan/LPS O-acetylase OafA/YrhL
MRPIAASMLWVTGTAVTLFSCWIELHIRFPLPWLKTPDRNLGYLVAAYVATLGFAVSLVAFNNLGRVVGVVLGPFERAIRWLGSLTFALYLFHVPLLSLFSAYLRGHIVLAMMATLAIVCTFGRFCEKSKTAYKRAFVAIVGQYRIYLASIQSP